MLNASERLYGLDIETDTAIDGLDPAVAAIVAVAVATASETFVLTGSEHTILRSLDELLAGLPAGLLTTWNGAGFDLPFIATRAQHRAVPIGLRLDTDGSDVWHGHGHLDGYLLYRADVGATLGLRCGLKAMARLVGLDPIEVDRADIGSLTPAELHAYVASDAEVTRDLVGRRPHAVRHALEREPQRARQRQGSSH